ncbi:MAG: nuclear transport factor 2 family protein [Acidobacteriota bacterium]|nr:nuclear transport factor 2 family protein [Acidobacteriota bacterium]
MSDRHDEIEREILRLEEELRQAEMRLDVATLDRTYADDIMVTAPIGIVVDKPAVMAEVNAAANNAKVETFDKDDFKVRAFGDTAVASYRLTAQARYQGQPISQHLRLTDVWMKRQERWQVVSRHTANITPQP